MWVLQPVYSDWHSGFDPTCPLRKLQFCWTCPKEEDTCPKLEANLSRLAVYPREQHFRWLQKICLACVFILQSCLFVSHSCISCTGHLHWPYSHWHHFHRRWHFNFVLPGTCPDFGAMRNTFAKTRSFKVKANRAGLQRQDAMLLPVQKFMAIGGTQHLTPSTAPEEAEYRCWFFNMINKLILLIWYEASILLFTNIDNNIPVVSHRRKWCVSARVPT